jgi:hypothetical protein
MNLNHQPTGSTEILLGTKNIAYVARKISATMEQIEAEGYVLLLEQKGVLGRYAAYSIEPNDSIIINPITKSFVGVNSGTIA